MVAVVSLAVLAAALVGEAHPTNYELLTMDALVRLPVGTPHVLTNFPRERAALLHAATRLELIDEHNSPYWLYGPGSFQDELDLMRDLFAELEGCPRLAEGEWLPPYEYAAAVCAFNRKWAEHLRETARWNPDWADRVEALLDRGRPVLAVYEHIGWYRSQWSTVSDRRKALRDARDLMGRAAWDRREWPENAVWEAFSERPGR